MRQPRRFPLRSVIALLGVSAVLPACGGGGGGGGGVSTTPVVLVSESAAGVDGDGDSDQQVVSANGQFVAFRSAATNLLGLPLETQGFTDIYRKDLSTGAIIRVSRTAAGAEPNQNSRNPAISADGNLIAYVSSANNIVTGTFAGTTQTNVYLFNATTLETVLISDGTTAGVNEANGNSDSPVVAVHAAGSARVAYQSQGTDIVNGLTNYNGANIYLGTVVTSSPMALTSNAIVSIASAGTDVGNSASTRPSISTDGNLIAFQSLATNLSAIADSNAISDIYVRNLLMVGAIPGGTNTRVSLSAAGAQITGGAGEGCDAAAISGDGTAVAFHTVGTSLGVDGSPTNDIFIRRNWFGAATTTQVSIHPTVPANNGATCMDPVVNGDGTQVLWHSATPVLVNGDNNLLRDAYLRDFGAANSLVRVSLNPDGSEQTGGAGSGSNFRPAVSSNGAFVVFDSTANSLVSPTPSAFRHVYRRG